MELVNFIESAILGLFSSFTIILYIMAFRRILNEKNNVFDKIDKSIIIAAGVQILFLTFVFVIISLNLFFVIIRLSRLFQEAVLWMILSFLVFDESKYEIIYKIMMGVSMFIGLFGLLSLFQLSFLDDSKIEINFILFSASTLFINTVNMCFGLKVLYIINDYFQKELNESNQDDSDFSEGEKNHLKFITFDEMNNRKMQIYILVSTHFISAISQFIWDIIAYECSENKNEYHQFYNPSNFYSLFLLILLKILVNFTPVWVIYFVFYWRNRTFYGDSAIKNNYMLVEFKRDSLTEI